MSEIPRKLCAYVMTADTGFAPNPFNGTCTLAGCTPNHMNARLSPGDLIAGFFHHAGRYRLVYVMEVSDVLDHDAYYRDPRFRKKRPGCREARWRDCGDNIYFRNATGHWEQDPATRHHRSRQQVERDLRHPVVFLGKRFRYFGGGAGRRCLPHGLRPIISGSNRGIKYTHSDSDAFRRFLEWAWREPFGRMGNEPRDREAGTGCAGVAGVGDRGGGPSRYEQDKARHKILLAG